MDVVPGLSVPGLLDGAAMRRWLLEMGPVEIDDALDYVDLLFRAAQMDQREASAWRWRLLAAWAELELRQRRAVPA